MTPRQNITFKESSEKVGQMIYYKHNKRKREGIKWCNLMCNLSLFSFSVSPGKELLIVGYIRWRKKKTLKIKKRVSDAQERKLTIYDQL